MKQSYVSPRVFVDIVLLTWRLGELQVALHTREKAPHEGRLALPGGEVHTDDLAEKDVATTAFRVLREKTGLVPRYLEQLKTFSGPGRDPERGWSVAISHFALIPLSELEKTEPGVFSFYPVNNLPPLAFDHKDQIEEAVQRIRNKSRYSTLPCWLLPEYFTLTQLQQMYEAILGEKWPRPTFRSRLGIKVGDVTPGEAVDEAKVLIATDQFYHSNTKPARLFKVDKLKIIGSEAF